MPSSYHILNGASLKHQFPHSIEGELIITRECLVDGDILGDSLQEFYSTRAKFLTESYGGSIQNYFDKVVSEFDKIKSLPQDSEVNLWFEEDLFCQVNFWFILHFLKQETLIHRVYLILPNKENRYGFGGMNTSELVESYRFRQLIDVDSFEQLSDFWTLYKANQIDSLRRRALKLRDKYPFLLTAVDAHLDRIPIDGRTGRPSRTLVEIMQELKTREFPVVFREFCKREAVYGYGDLQVKKLFDEVISGKMNRSN